MELENEVEELKEKCENLQDKLQRTKQNLAWAKNGVRYLRSELNEYEDAPSSEVVENIGQFVNENKDLIEGFD